MLSTRRPAGSTLFPYTTLFRSEARRIGADTVFHQRAPGAEGATRGETRRSTCRLGLRARNTDSRSAKRVSGARAVCAGRSEEHTSELQSRLHLVCRLLLEKKTHDRLYRFYHTANPLRAYSRVIASMFLTCEGLRSNDSHAYCYQSFCVPAYGTANGFLHFH